MQLVEDRRQVVAKENAKLMELMTNVRLMSSRCCLFDLFIYFL